MTTFYHPFVVVLKTVSVKKASHFGFKLHTMHILLEHKLKAYYMDMDE